MGPYCTLSSFDVSLLQEGQKRILYGQVDVHAKDRYWYETSAASQQQADLLSVRPPAPASRQCTGRENATQNDFFTHVINPIFVLRMSVICCVPWLNDLSRWRSLNLKPYIQIQVEKANWIKYVNRAKLLQRGCESRHFLWEEEGHIGKQFTSQK